MDILRHYMDDKTTSDSNLTEEHYEEVARAAPSDVLGRGVAAAFRDQNTPSFGDMVAQLFGHSSPQQRAGVVNQLLHSIGPGVMALLGGVIRRESAPANSVVPQLTPAEAAALTPAQVKEIATEAQQKDPEALEKIGDFYSQHP